MASDKKDNLASEIAYVKTLAEEGRNAPLIGGVFYVVWGVTLALACLLTWLRAAEIDGVPDFIGGIGFWIAVFIVGWGISFYFGRKIGAKPGAMTIGNRTAMAAWCGVGVFMLVYWFSLLAFHGNFESEGIKPYALFNTMFPIAFGVYGIAFFATATAARLDWLRGFAVSAWIFSVASLYFMGDAKQIIVAGAGSLICAALPGYILMRREPSDIV